MLVSAMWNRPYSCNKSRMNVCKPIVKTVLCKLLRSIQWDNLHRMDSFCSCVTIKARCVRERILLNPKVWMVAEFFLARLFILMRKWCIWKQHRDLSDDWNAEALMHYGKFHQKCCFMLFQVEYPPLLPWTNILVHVCVSQTESHGWEWILLFFRRWSDFAEGSVSTGKLDPSCCVLKNLKTDLKAAGLCAHTQSHTFACNDCVWVYLCEPDECIVGNWIAHQREEMCAKTQTHTHTHTHTHMHTRTHIHKKRSNQHRHRP